ncbi:MAG: hypothetical protein ACRCTA_00350, partial [Bacilli bacterium]
ILLRYEYDTYNNPMIFYDSLKTIALEDKYLLIKNLQKELIETIDPLQQALISQEIIELNQYINDQKNKKLNEKGS